MALFLSWIQNNESNKRKNVSAKNQGRLLRSTLYPLLTVVKLGIHFLCGVGKQSSEELYLEEFLKPILQLISHQASCNLLF